MNPPLVPLVRDAFLEPAFNLLSTLNSYRDDLDFSDLEFLTLGVRRINTFHPSGRSFLQSARQCDLTEVSLRAYFGAVSSARRLTFLHDLNTALSRKVTAQVDRFAAFPELAGWDVLALDGHDIAHATHEPRATMANGRREVPDTVTGVFLRDLRTGAARVLAQTEGHQHEWAAVKARPWIDFHWQPEARKTILVIDPVAVDFAFLLGAKFKGGFTVITRTKANLVVRESKPLPWDKQDRRNQGVLSDERVRFAGPGEFRRVVYQDPESAEVYEFLTTEFHLPPGIIAQLYRLRWDIEKFFDVCENLLAEKRAWGSGPVAAQVQNEFLVLVHNLFLLLSATLETQEGIRDEKVDRKYEAGLQVRIQAAKSKGRTVSPWVRALRQITRWSSQFTRWVQDALIHGWDWNLGIEKLRPLMRAYLR
jgi:hypothetical protein